MVLSQWVLAGVMMSVPPVGGLEAPPSGSASVHAEHRAAALAPARRFARALDEPDAVGAFSTWVYGYYATWAGELEDLPWDRLTHVAIFDVELTASGGLTRTANWTDNAPTALALGEPYGVRVHLAVTCFDDVVMSSVLQSANLRVAAADALAAAVDDVGAHGVSVDFEGMSAGNREGLIAFVQLVSDRVEDVTVATPAIDWNGAYDYDALVDAGGKLFIMGYDYHWRGGDPGPVAPLSGGAPWGQYSLQWSLDDYEMWGAPPADVILGLPLYGYNWPSVGTGVPGQATAQASSVLLADAVAEVDAFGRQYDDVTQTPYYFPGGPSQAWYDDIESLDAKIGWAVEQGVAGIGFWALNYEGGDPAFWDMVADHTQTAPEDPGDDGGSTGDAPDDPPRGTTGDADPGPDATTGDDEPPPGNDTDDGIDPGWAEPVDMHGTGCGCRSTPGPAGAAPWLLLVFGLIGRRRACRSRRAPSPRG